MSSISKTNRHILIDPIILETIVGAAELHPGEKVLEIGPGTGNLTEPLAQTGSTIVGVELDKRMTEYLSPLETRYENLQIDFGDALNRDLSKFEQIVSNIPFNISEPLILKMIDYNVPKAVLLVGESLVNYLEDPLEQGSTLGFLASAHYTITNVCPVPSTAFHPEPSTDGAVLKLKAKTGHKDMQSYLIRHIWKHRHSRAGDAIKNAIVELASEFGKSVDLNPILENMDIPEYLQNQRVKDMLNTDFTTLMYALYDSNTLSELKQQIKAGHRTGRKLRQPDISLELRSRNHTTRQIHRQKHEKSARAKRVAQLKFEAVMEDPI
jgi:16S rRNA (adenine1518-N6/adenine1519-N6)-dimethyltransferase